MVAFGDLLVFETTCIIAEPRKELTEILHLLKHSVSSLKMRSDVSNHKRAKKRMLCYIEVIAQIY